MRGQPALYSFPDAEALATSLRSYILSAQKAGLNRHHVFKVAVSGGSLPNTLAKALLSPGNSPTDTVQWDTWEIFFADERAVPLDNADSNYKLLKEELLDKLPADGPKPKVHTINEQLLNNIQELADQYEQGLVSSFAAKDSVKLPIFDLLLLGCGPDGHTCSLFPQHELLREADAWVVPISDSPKPPPQRITLTLPVITHGLRIAFVATGKSKMGIMREIFDTEEGQGLPCGLVNDGGGDRVSWFTDQNAIEGVSYPSSDSGEQQQLDLKTYISVVPAHQQTRNKCILTMQQPPRPRALRQPTASKLPLNPDTQYSGVAAEDPRSQRPTLKPSEDVSNPSSRLPAPIISKLHGGGGNATGPKRRSMLPQLSPTKGYGAALEAGKREHAQTHESDSKPNNGGILPITGADGTRDGIKGLPILGSPVRQSRNMGVTSDNTFSEDTPLRQDASTKQLGGLTYPMAAESVSSRPRTLPQPRAVSAIVGLRSRPAPSETKGAGGREIIAKSAVPGRPRPPRQPTATSANTSRDTTNWTGLPIASARPRSLILSAGRDFGQEIRPASSTSASSTELAPSEEPDPKWQPPVNARHKRTPSTRSERAAYSGKSKELDRRDASGKAVTSTREASATGEQKKPAFSTLQQHFTPKKALKAPTPFHLATAAGKQSSGESMSPETARLQTELLQLHLLHGPSAEVLHSWQGSVEVKLQKRFEDVAQNYRRVAALERKTQAQLNLRALKEFARDGRAGQDLGERIQSLGSVIPEIVNVTDAGGKYARLVKNFEWWIEWIEQIQETRGRGGSAFSSVGELKFVDGLGNGWRDETATLSRKLGFWLQDLDGVRSSPAGSSLALVVARCRYLVEGMLQELDIMRGMERAIVARESCWVSEKVAELLAEIDSGPDKADSAPTTDKESGGKQGIWMPHGKGYLQST